MEKEFGLRELYEVKLKSTYPIEVNGINYGIGEVIAEFDKISVANLNEDKTRTTAHGGFNDSDLVFWEETKAVNLTFTQGVFSKNQFALLVNSKLLHNDGTSKILISNREKLESNENGVITLKYDAVAPIFVYNESTGLKLTHTVLDAKHIQISNTYCDVIVDYQYYYNNGYSILRIGQQFTTNYLTLEGKTRIKDDITGQVKTGIIKIPKLKLMSDLSMRLGREATPMMGQFTARALPEGERGKEKVVDIFFLEDDIDSDM